ERAAHGIAQAEAPAEGTAAAFVRGASGDRQGDAPPRPRRRGAGDERPHRAHRRAPAGCVQSSAGSSPPRLMDPFQREHHTLGIASLIEEGRSLRSRLDRGETGPGTLTAVRAWQQGCAAAINELSGGSKAHWLSRAFSE